MLKAKHSLLLLTLICTAPLFGDTNTSAPPPSSAQSSTPPTQPQPQTPTPPQSATKTTPNTTNAIQSKAQVEQTDDVADLKCEQGEIYKDGHCKPASSDDLNRNKERSPLQPLSN